MVIGFNFGRPVNVAVIVVKELLSLQELLHVDQLVDYVEVYVNLNRFRGTSTVSEGLGGYFRFLKDSAPWIFPT
jgi:hypothetical protein